MQEKVNFLVLDSNPSWGVSFSYIFKYQQCICSNHIPILIFVVLYSWDSSSPFWDISLCIKELQKLHVPISPKINCKKINNAGDQFNNALESRRSNILLRNVHKTVNLLYGVLQEDKETLEIVLYLSLKLCFCDA